MSWPIAMNTVRHWITRNRLQFFFALLCVLGGLIAVWTISEVIEGDSTSIDTAILLFIKDMQAHNSLFSHSRFQEFMRDVTGLGGTGILTCITLFTAIYLVLVRRVNDALLVVSAIVSGVILSSFLKDHFDRPRPDLLPHATEIHSASLPSGHALMSAVAYLTIGAVLARTRHGLALKIYIMATAIVITLLVGISRVYLGVHWPSDVIAGWLVGTLWAAVFWLLADWLNHRGLTYR